MGVGGYSWAGEPTAGDLVGEAGVDLVDFFFLLRNLEIDRLSDGCRGGREGEPLKDAGEGQSGRVVEVERDCGESVSFWGNRMGKRDE